ncbi:hypothetical protein Tsubulata_017744 [Turnera subulata]|uniref:C2 NT-type domain-containing protein n=1 Tax=Turnera subulata TaxID=218843 RepID=A0A9Q0GIJ1_9ROSI|nr:hypothetical protein Tsubulata_017744 [Turnera subulata]
MVVKMMRWPPWPPLSTRKFEVTVMVHKGQGLSLADLETENDGENKKKGLVVEIKWMGQRSIGLGALRRSVKRNLSGEGVDCGGGVFEWDEEFKSACNLSETKNGLFYPWEVAFTVFKDLNQKPRNKLLVVGVATANISEFASTAVEEDHEITVPLIVPGRSMEGGPTLTLSVRLMELRTASESQLAEQMTDSVPQSPCFFTLSPQKDESTGLRAGLRKVRILRGNKKARHEEESSDGHGKPCAKSEDVDDNYPFDTDSFDDDDQGDSESNGDSNTQLSVHYETLAYANIAGRSLHSHTIIDAVDEDWIYYKGSKPDTGSYTEYSTVSVPEQSLRQSSVRGILRWRQRKLRFGSPKKKGKEEPLLKKGNGEEGGDDIDFDRRQLSSSDESSLGWNKSEEGSSTSRSSFSEFGDDSFAVGSWELKEVISRDGHMKLQTQVFFASIDQRSERAAGESACTALVAVIADWLQSNRYEVPIKSEFDSLIRDGSLEWRNLCENEEYRQRFPDKHFDLETVIQAKIRPLTVVPEKSFIGFFHPEGLEGDDFDFLLGAMSFDSIWQEISRHESNWPSNCDHLVYIVSWNDHFFVLKVEQDAYYIIDTLGERLYEGCNQAYVLKFDKDTTIHRLPPKDNKGSDEKSANDNSQPKNSKTKSSAESCLPSKAKSSAETCSPSNEKEEELLCKGKDSCKEYIKSFLAAIPLRELQADIKKGLMASTPLHHRLQIEFQYTQLTPPAAEDSCKDVAVC